MNVPNKCDLLPVNLKSEPQELEQPDENNNLPSLSTLTVCNDQTNSHMDQVRMRALAEKHQKLKLIYKLIKCVESNNFDHFRFLLTQKPDLNLMVDGQCLIHFCIMMRRDVSWCKELVQCGANPNLSNLDGWHPMHMAAFYGLTETFNYLISLYRSDICR